MRKNIESKIGRYNGNKNGVTKNENKAKENRTL